jgi:hypothetical protein
MSRRSSSLGVSLIEALVALAVMAFGLLGVVGMQATLRFNADVSKQRTEAVRMAQEQIESLRSFAALRGTAGLDYDEVASIPSAVVPTTAGFANTVFNRTTTVFDPAVTDPQFKSVIVNVSWLDRQTADGGLAQNVTFVTTIAEVAPEMSASLGLPGDRAAPQRPRGRHPTIPAGAVDLGDGRSSFTPPGAPVGTTWNFVNATGQITQICTPTCTDIKAWLLSGYIAFATGGSPTAAEAETPADANPVLTHAISVEVLATTTPAPATSPVCFAADTALTVQYFCLVPTNTAPTTWDGRSRVNIIDKATSTSSVSTELIDTSTTRFKVCRYTPEATHTPTGGNAAHPLDYDDVGTSLVNQNFLVISAGDGLVAFACPGDDTITTPLVNSNTFMHQPII